MDFLGNALRITPNFRGKWRVQRLWEDALQNGDRRTAILPDGSQLAVEMHIPYERMVWLQAEEWDDLLYLQSKLRPGQVFIDVGANVGLWTLVGASCVGAAGRILSFEPNPHTFRKLSENIVRNQKTSIVEAFQNAVSDCSSVAQFLCEAAHNVSALTDRVVTNSVQVRTVSLDCCLAARPDLPQVTGIKLDTEGHELAALKGSLGIIRSNCPWLIVEFNTTLLPSMILRDWAVYRFLSSLGYKAYLYAFPFEERAIDDKFAVKGYRNILFQFSE